MSAHEHLRLLVESANRAREARYAWMRWLALLASGFFSLMAGQLSGKPWALGQLWSLKAALTLNLLGILALAAALYDEAAGLRRLSSALREQALQRLEGTSAATTRAPVSSNTSTISRAAEWVGYACLAASLLAWTAFVWLL